ncbi:MAG: V4R domain-containing protein [Myxococcota bacterium]
MHEAPGSSPVFANIYRPDEYFSHNVNSGTIRAPTGTRMLTVPEHLLIGIHEALLEETGAASPVVLYRCGRWWGRRFAQRYFAEVRHFYRVDAGELSLGVFLMLLRRAWGMMGWGNLEISFGLREHGFIEAKVQGSIYSEVIGHHEQPREQLVAGLLASIIGEISGRELECVQTSCKSVGAEQCVFLVGIKSRIDLLEAWVRQGRSHASIVETIREGALA